MGYALLLVLQLAPAAMGFADKKPYLGDDTGTFLLTADVDGDPRTTDYAGWDTAGKHAGEWRTVIVRGGQVCVSAYLTHADLLPDDPGGFYFLNLMTPPGSRSVLQVQSVRWIKHIPLPIPTTCR